VGLIQSTKAPAAAERERPGYVQASHATAPAASSTRTTCHARVEETVAKSQFPLKAVVFSGPHDPRNRTRRQQHPHHLRQPILYVL
jgi:hypothetical protein